MTATWLDVPADHPFGIANLPYGVFSTAERSPRVGVRIGDWVLDAGAAAELAGMESGEVWLQPSLNAFLAAGRDAWTSARAWLIEMLTDEAHRDGVEPHLLPVGDVTMHLPIEVADYVDFYASEHHATNVGRIFRPDGAALTPNWKHLPIGYHGRAGTVVVSGTDVVRPQRPAQGALRRGARPSARASGSTSRPSSASSSAERRRSATGSPSTRPPTTSSASSLLNDWSARDIQAWEYVPLGPFLGKSFATSVSAWVVTLDALRGRARRAARAGPAAAALPAGRRRTLFGLDIHFEVGLNGTVVARPEYRDMYWSPAQMLAHLTVNGASLRNGDLFALGHDLADREKQTRGQPARAHVERHRAARAGRRLDPHLPRGRRHRDAPRLGPGPRRRPHRPRRGDRDHPARALGDRTAAG